MAVAMEETYLSRSGDSTARKVKFVVTGTDDDAVARAYAEANAPSTHDGLVFQKVSNITQQSDQRWIVTCAYGQLTGTAATIPEPDAGTASYSFAATVEPETFFYSRERVGTFPAGAPAPANGLIGLQMSDGTGRHAGITVPAGPVTDEVTYEYPAAVIPASYRSTVRSLIGGVNNASFLGNAAGTTRLVAVRAQITSESKQSITFSWAYRPNRDVTIGDHALGLVAGWDFPWSYDETRTFTDPDGREVPIIHPKFVYIERLVDAVNMGQLGLPTF